MPALVLLLGTEIPAVVEPSLLMIALKSAAGIIEHPSNPIALPWAEIFAFIDVGIAGLFAGAKLTRILPVSRLQQAFALCVCGLGLVLLLINGPKLPITETLKAEGFGVLTTIDVRATLKNRLNVDVEQYVILGACNPALAHRALTLEPEVGLLLPCNVVIREGPEASGQPQTRIDIADPMAMLTMVRHPQMQDVATEAKARLQRVIAALPSV